MSSTLQEQDYTQKFSFGLWKKILRYTPAYHGRLIRLCLWMVVTAVIDILFPLMTRYAIDKLIPMGNMDGVPAFTAVYVLLLLLPVHWRQGGNRHLLRIQEDGLQEIAGAAVFLL